jgi:hypothetical protein
MGCAMDWLAGRLACLIFVSPGAPSGWPRDLSIGWIGLGARVNCVLDSCRLPVRAVASGDLMELSDDH